MDLDLEENAPATNCSNEFEVPLRSLAVYFGSEAGMGGPQPACQKLEQKEAQSDLTLDSLELDGLDVDDLRLDPLSMIRFLGEERSMLVERLLAAGMAGEQAEPAQAS